MACYDTMIDGEPIIEGWLDLTQASLFESWHKRTGHKPSATNATWACEIARSCRTCNEHLSLPCSLLAEANEIGCFLEQSSYSEEPATFLRLLLILLSEFTGQLRDVGGMLKLQTSKPPKLLSVWGNNWAKHRLSLIHI